MRAKIARPLRRTSRGEIVQAAAYNAANCTDSGRNQAAVGQFADPDREINMVFYEVHQTIGQHDLDVYVGVVLEERRYDRKDVQPSEDDRGGDDQVAFGCTVFA